MLNIIAKISGWIAVNWRLAGYCLKNSLRKCLLMMGQSRLTFLVINEMENMMNIYVISNAIQYKLIIITFLI